MALTKSVALVQDWTTVAQNAVGESDILDVSGCYAFLLHIEIALTAEVAHTGTKIRIEYSSNTTGDEDWTLGTEWIGPTGTPNSQPITNDPAAPGTTVLTVTDTTGLYDDDEVRNIYIKDSTIANSELGLLVSHSANASVTLQDGTKNNHVVTTPLWDIAMNYSIRGDWEANRVRVIIDNTYDPDGASCDYRVRASKVTAI